MMACISLLWYSTSSTAAVCVMSALCCLAPNFPCLSHKLTLLPLQACVALTPLSFCRCTPSPSLLKRLQDMGQGGRRQADMLLPWTRPLPHMSRPVHSSFTVASHPTCNRHKLLYLYVRATYGLLPTLYSG